VEEGVTSKPAERRVRLLGGDCTESLRLASQGGSIRTTGRDLVVAATLGIGVDRHRQPHIKHPESILLDQVKLTSTGANLKFLI
jgi:hypothetical protein